MAAIKRGQTRLCAHPEGAIPGLEQAMDAIGRQSGGHSVSVPGPVFHWRQLEGKLLQGLIIPDLDGPAFIERNVFFRALRPKLVPTWAKVVEDKPALGVGELRSR